MRNIDKKYHYLYKTTNILNDKYYYGIHSTNNLEDGYLGSGTRIKYSIRKYGQENFKKEIIEYFSSRSDLIQAEIDLLTRELLENKQCMNIKFGGDCGTLGRVNVKDKDGKMFSVFVDDHRYLSGELISANKGLILAKDINNKTFSITKDDTRWINGELTGVTINTTPVKNKDGKIFRIDINDERYLSGELVSIFKNTIPIKNKLGEKFRVDKNDKRYLSGELVSIWKEKKHKQETKDKIGLANSIIQKGEGNSQFGTCWITKDNENKKIKKEELEYYLSLGWIKGRKLK